MDVFSKNKRKEIMRNIRSKNTKPEKFFAKKIKEKGLKIAMHRKSLPGNPDIIITKHKTAIFIHGCFWHQHKGCKRCFMPKSNRKYWKPKLENNVKRFNAQRKSLNNKGWHVFVVWECQIKKPDTVEKKINFILKKMGIAK